MITQHTFESLILTNTIVAAFCIVLLITFTVFIILFLIPSIRRRWIYNNNKEENKINDITPLSRQPSLHHSCLNPLFEPTTGTTTTTTTQFGTLFHPHATAATLLHPTIWTSMAPTSVISSPLTVQSAPTPPISRTLTAAPPPSLPSHPPTTTTAQRSPGKH